VAQEPELNIRDWHAHVYFDANEADAAGALCSAMRRALGVAMGRVHRVPVGPHPRGSCQMTVPREQLGAALDWLVRHRGKFTVFMHGNSGDDLRDHTALVVWLGASEPLNLGIFS
jgi:aromatic ring-cleaving dioxygenase